MKIKGHTTVILKDVKTGKIERHEDDNMITNAIQDYFQNCGFMNYPNLDKNNLVETLLGGVMAFDDEIAENVNTVYAPAGLKMIANGSVGTVNNSNVLEMGSYSTTESGWQDDGSYVQTYDYTTSQANGTIACVCLTSKAYGFIGEGNSISQVKHSSSYDMYALKGSITAITGITGAIFNVNLTDSSCMTFMIESRTDPQTEETYKVGVLRKYRLPISKINIKGTLSSPILLSETEIQIDADLAGASWTTLVKQPYEDKLYIYNTAQAVGFSIPDWGDGFTQYFWTLSASGQLTKTTVVNTSGDTLKCLGMCYFDGNYGIFPKTISDGPNAYIDSGSIYIWNRTNGTMTRIDNPYHPQNAIGVGGGNNINWTTYTYLYGFVRTHSSGDGKIICIGNYAYVIDAVNQTVYATNASTSTQNLQILYDTSGPLIKGATQLQRDLGYIASINNLDTPVVKTAEKTMKIIYRLTFEDV